MEHTKSKGPKVHRWNFVAGDKGVDGEFVRREDYAALEAENRRLREVLGYIVEHYESGEELSHVLVANMYDAAKAALAQDGSKEENNG